MKIILGVVGALVLLAGIWFTAGLRAENQALRDRIAEYESRTRAASPRAVPRIRVPGANTGARALSEEARETLRAELSLASDERVWFVTQANDPEADSFQREIEATFLESGWEVAGSTQSTELLRAGIRVLIADDDLAEHVSIAVNGLNVVGLEVFAGTGYRAFYESKKENDPSFSGIELAPDQDFVIVVGRKPVAVAPL